MESENRALHLGEISPGVRLGLSPQQPDVPLEKELKESHSKCVQWKKMERINVSNVEKWGTL